MRSKFLITNTECSNFIVKHLITFWTYKVFLLLSLHLIMRRGPKANGKYVFHQMKALTIIEISWHYNFWWDCNFSRLVWPPPVWGKTYKFLGRWYPPSHLLISILLNDFSFYPSPIRTVFFIDIYIYNHLRMKLKSFFLIGSECTCQCYK